MSINEDKDDQRCLRQSASEASHPTSEDTPADKNDNKISNEDVTITALPSSLHSHNNEDKDKD